MEEIRVSRLKFKELDEDSGFYSATVTIEHRGMFSLTCYTYHITFNTYDNRRDGLINPRSPIINQTIDVTNHRHTELVNLFLPYLQKEVDKLN